MRRKEGDYHAQGEEIKSKLPEERWGGGEKINAKERSAEGWQKGESLKRRAEQNLGERYGGKEARKGTS